jgi:hypothetical protein
MEASGVDSGLGVVEKSGRGWADGVRVVGSSSGSSSGGGGGSVVRPGGESGQGIVGGGGIVMVVVGWGLGGIPVLRAGGRHEGLRLTAYGLQQSRRREKTGRCWAWRCWERASSRAGRLPEP